jgi:hypothetical protein
LWTASLSLCAWIRKTFVCCVVVVIHKNRLRETTLESEEEKNRKGIILEQVFQVKRFPCHPVLPYAAHPTDRFHAGD